MDASEFAAKWRGTTLTERSAAQQHFLDLCELLDHPKPAALDRVGDSFTFEKGAQKLGGGDGWADVWKRRYFAWEYKGRHKDLEAAYYQLQKYRDALENPPLLVVSDMDRIIVRTNFTNTAPQIHEIDLPRLDTPESLRVLWAVFYDPDRLRPDARSEFVTLEAARRIGEIAQGLRDRGLEPHEVALFLDRIIFCFFAEDVGLLPRDLFKRLVEKTHRDPEHFQRLVGELFRAMAAGGDFGLDTIRHFNGNLFTDGPVLELALPEMESVRGAAQLDWSAVDPSIFGTLFERGLDPDRRSQLGAHYTSREDIRTLVEPVVIQPLRREWDEVRRLSGNLLLTGRKDGAAPAKPLSKQAIDRARLEARGILLGFQERLGQVKVLDPACGSGNFLYVALQMLKDLEKEVTDFAMTYGFSGFLPLPGVGPWQLYGIEVNPYAYDLAQMTVWIGYLQWAGGHGYPPDNPVLRKMSTFECKDAILDLSDPDNPKDPEWPRVDFIVGNPPFLGDKKMRGELGDLYVDALRRLYAGRLPGRSDLCCYWFEKTRAAIHAGRACRAGLLATQGIRGGDNRRALERIKATGGIFWAWSDRPWILDGATVHVSMVGFDNGVERELQLDGGPASVIHANLTPGTTANSDPTRALPLQENAGICYLGVMKAGPFDIPESVALVMLASPNAHRVVNSDVLRPRLTAKDLLQRTGGGWIVDFGCNGIEDWAARFELPWEHVRSDVRPARAGNHRARLASQWWIHGEARPGLRTSLSGLSRFIITPEVSKHRVFAWLDSAYLADHQTRAIARQDDSTFGVLHSRLHELWARSQGTQLRERESGFRYTPTTCFETFPFPRPTPEQEAAIAQAARELDELRNRWLNPTEWTREEALEFPGSVDGPWARYLHDPDDRGIGIVRYPRLIPRDTECAKKLAARTLTNLYNQRPTWLDLAHRRLDEAVFAAYGWPPELADDEILERLLSLNLERAAAEGQ